jgi:hypothetical protein
MVNEEVNFNSLKELINVTDGNLASHLKALRNVIRKSEKGLLKKNKHELCNYENGR